MKNIMLRIAYDGSQFSGFQKQDKQRTVGGELEKAIEKLTERKVRLVGAGRTDAGVHAEDQVVNFLTTASIQGQGFSYLLQPLLPDDILCVSSEEVGANFHARFAARRKTYRYVLSLAEPFFPTQRLYKAHCPFPLDLDLMEEALGLFIGKHNFSAFSKYNSLRQPVRFLEDFTMVKEGDDLIFHLSGESFLHNQVRILIGTMVQIGRGKLSRSQVQTYLDQGGKRTNMLTYPACGLTLEKTEIDPNWNYEARKEKWESL